VSCAKTAEPIEMQFVGLLSQVGPGNMYYMRCRCPHKKGIFGCPSSWKAFKA